MEERLERALRAKTYGDLDACVSDIPTPVARRSRSRRIELARTHPVAAATLVLAATVAVVAVVAVVALMLFWFVMAWGVWMVLALFMFSRGRGAGFRHRSYRYGPPGGYTGPRHRGLG